MPQPHSCWRHVTISTRLSWNPGDPRGWRSRHHKQHSGGDYNHPPPPAEHLGLRDYLAKHLGPAITIARPIRVTIGQAVVGWAEDADLSLLVIAVCGRHTHMLIELPEDIRRVRHLVGHAKRTASRAARDVMPGRIWSAGGHFEPVLNDSHHRSTYRYIRDKQGPGAWVWTYRDATREGRWV